MKETKLKNLWFVCMTAIVCTILWGSAFPCVKLGYELFQINTAETGSQILFAGYRFTLAGILAWMIASVRTKRPVVPKKEVCGSILLLGLVQTTAQYLFFYIGMSHTTGIKGSVITASNSFFCILLAHFIWKKERITLRKGIGCLLGFLGVFFINFTPKGMEGGFSFLGEGLILFACLAYAIGAVYIKTFAHKENGITITAYQLFIGGLVLILIGFLMGGRVNGFSWKSSLLLLYMAGISAVAFSLWTLLLTYNSVGKVSVYGFATPVFGVLLSALFLGENAFTLKNVGALALVSAGIVVVNMTKKDLPGDL